jgi:hypothetical protein
MPLGTDFLDAARLQRRLWTPLQLRGVGKLGAWFDIKDPSTISYATGISEWRDKGGLGLHATQATAADQPVYQPTSGVVNGLPSIYFAGSGNRGLHLPSLSGLWSAIEGFYVWRSINEGSTSQGCVLGDFGVHVQGDHEPFTDGVVYTGFGSSVRKTVGNPGPSLIVPRINRIRSATNDWSYSIDGTVIFSTGTNTVSLGATPIIGGVLANTGTYYPLNGYVSEVVLISGTTTLREQQLLEGYLAWNWELHGNILSSHPFKNRPPLIGD